MIRPLSKRGKKRGGEKVYEDEGLFNNKDESDKFEALIIQDWKIQEKNSPPQKKKKLGLNHNVIDPIGPAAG